MEKHIQKLRIPFGFIYRGLTWGLKLRLRFSLLFVFAATIGYAQAPHISYSSPQTYPLGVSITPLTPSASGVGTSGSYNTVTLASFIRMANYDISGIAVDAAGNTYVTNYYSNDYSGNIQEIQTGGAIINLGSGFYHPTGVAVDTSGNVYVADNGNNAIYKIPSGNGHVVTIAKSSSGNFNPYGIALDGAGNIYFSDNAKNEVWKIAAGTSTPVVIGTGFYDPNGVAVDAAGNVYVADAGNNAVKKILAGSGTIVTLSSGYGAPAGVAVDAGGNVYFADTYEGSIAEIPASGGSNMLIGAGFDAPNSIAVGVTDPNILYVGDQNNKAVKELTPTGGYFISPALPAGLSLDPASGIISGTPTAAGPATNYTVKAYNIGGAGSATVSITVQNAGLSALTLSSGTLSPAFATSIANYTVSEANSVSSITLTPTTSDPAYTVTINGTAVTSGAASSAIALNVGTDTISVAVATSGGTIISNYTVIANRAPSSIATLSLLQINGQTISPTFASATTSYTSTISGAAASVNVEAYTSDANATITINGMAVASGAASPGIPLVIGSNTITTVVTAQDGITQQTYTITVTRLSNNASLSNLGISNSFIRPVFSSGVYSYTAVEYSGITSITVTPTTGDSTATVTVNSVPVTSGTPSASIPLSFGLNTITTVVTAQNGVTQQTYTLTVTRPPAINANLALLQISGQAISPAFDTNVTGYTSTVPGNITSVKVEAWTSDPSSTLTINGTTVASGGHHLPCLWLLGLILSPLL